VEIGRSFNGDVSMVEFVSLSLVLPSVFGWSSSSHRRSGSFVAGAVWIASNATPSRHTAAMERGEEDMRVAPIESSPFVRP